MNRAPRVVCTAAAAMLLGGCATAPLPPTDPADKRLPPAPRAGFVAGYLPKGRWIDSLALLPPPAAGSPARAADDDAYRRAGQAAGSARWVTAAADAELRFPKAAGAIFANLVAFNPLFDIVTP